MALISMIVSIASVILSAALVIVNIKYSNNNMLINQNNVFLNFLNNKNYQQLIDLFDDELFDIDEQVQLIKDNQNEIGTMFLAMDSMIAIIAHSKFRRVMDDFVESIGDKRALCCAIDVINSSHKTLKHLKKAINKTRKRQLKMEFLYES